MSRPTADEIERKGAQNRSAWNKGAVEIARVAIHRDGSLTAMPLSKAVCCAGAWEENGGARVCADCGKYLGPVVAKSAKETRHEAGNGQGERSGTCFTLELPYPPSKNALDVRRVATSKAGKRYSARSDSGVYRDYKRAVWLVVRKDTRVEYLPIDGDLRLSVTLYPPDKRRRDLLNGTEAICDAMTYAGVWNDDSQVKLADVHWGEVAKGGKCVIRIEEA